MGKELKTRSSSIYSINQWARQNPTRVFEDAFKTQRLYLDDDTWDIIYDNYPDIKLGSKEYNMLPERLRQKYISKSHTGEDTTKYRKERKQIEHNRKMAADDFEEAEDFYLNKLSHEIPEELLQIVANKLELTKDQVEAYNNVFDDAVKEYRTSKSKAKRANATYDEEMDRNYPYWIDEITKGLFHNNIFLPDGHVNNGSIFNKIYRGYRKYINKPDDSDTSVDINGAGTPIIDLSQNALRVGPNTELKSILFNEFWEPTNTSVFPASDVKNGLRTDYGDRHLPLSDISIYAGIEDGTYKAGPIDTFRDETIVYPARNVKRALAPITLFNLSGDSSVPLNSHAYKDATDEIYNTSNLRFGEIDYGDWQPKAYTSGGPVINEPWKYYGNLLQDIMQSSSYIPLNETYDPSKGRVGILDRLYSVPYVFRLPNRNQALKEALNSQRIFKSSIEDNDQDLVVSDLYFLNHMDDADYNVLHSIYQLAMKEREKAYNHYWPMYLPLYDLSYKARDTSNTSDAKYGYVDINGNEGSISDWKASILDGKFVLANPKGGIFINRVLNMNLKLLDWLNNYLKENPSYVIRPDLGGFGLTYLDNPTYLEYLSQYQEGMDPNDPTLYTIGTTASPMEFKLGGSIKKRIHGKNF